MISMDGVTTLYLMLPTSLIINLEQPRLRLSDDQAWQQIVRIAGVSNSSEFQKLDRRTQWQAFIQLKEFGASVRQLQCLTGIDRGIIQRARWTKHLPQGGMYPPTCVISVPWHIWLLHCFLKIQLTTLRVPNSIHRRAESSSYDHPPLFRRSHGRWVQRKSVKRDIIHNNAAICSFVGKGLHGHSALNNLLNKLRFHLIIVVFIAFLKTNKFHLIIYKRYRQRERYHIIIRKFAQSN